MVTISSPKIVYVTGGTHIKESNDAFYVEYSWDFITSRNLGTTLK